MSLPLIDTAPIKRAYTEMSAKIDELNKPVFKINMKTVAKTALTFIAIMGASIALFWGAAVLAGIALPIVSWTLKSATVMAITFGITMTGSSLAMDELLKTKSKTRKEFTDNFNKELKEFSKKNSHDVNCAIFGYYGSASFVNRDVRNIEFNWDFLLDKAKLDSYETVEQRYIELQRANIRREQDREEEIDRTFLQRPTSSHGLFSFLSWDI